MAAITNNEIPEVNANEAEISKDVDVHNESKPKTTFWDCFRQISSKTKKKKLMVYSQLQMMSVKLTVILVNHT